MPTEGVTKTLGGQQKTVRKISKTDSSRSAIIIDSIDASRRTKKQVLEDVASNQLVWRQIYVLGWQRLQKLL